MSHPEIFATFRIIAHQAIEFSGLHTPRYFAFDGISVIFSSQRLLLKQGYAYVITLSAFARLTSVF